jgi:hypothetical protein
VEVGGGICMVYTIVNFLIHLFLNFLDFLPGSAFIRSFDLAQLGGGGGDWFENIAGQNERLPIITGHILEPGRDLKLRNSFTNRDNRECLQKW